MVQASTVHCVISLGYYTNVSIQTSFLFLDLMKTASLTLTLMPHPTHLLALQTCKG